MGPQPQRGSIDRNAVVSALPVGGRIGNCAITGLVRHGVYSIVYATVEPTSRRRLAIKEYVPAMLADRMADGGVVVRSLRHQDSFRAGLQAFLDEAFVLAAVDRPALVKVLQSWEEHGTAYMAMPLYEGRPLTEVLREMPRPTEAWLKSLVAPILEALASLHALERYPRDVSPDNILIRDDGAPLLLGYGAARRAIALTAEDAPAGFKPGFTPIEQYAHDAAMPEGPWTDIYAVAAVLYYAITGRAPPPPATRLVADTMPPLSEIARGYTEHFLEGIDRGLALRPEHRPQEIGAFRSSLGIATVTPIGASRRGAALADRARTTQADDASASAQSTADESERISVLGDGSRPRPGPQLVVPPPPEAAIGSRGGARAWTLVAAGVAVAAIAVFAYFGSSPGPAKPGPTGGDAARTGIAPAAGAPEAGGVTLPPASTAAPGAAEAAAAGSTVAAAAAGDAAPRAMSGAPALPAPASEADRARREVSSPAASVVAAAAPATAPTTRTAKLQFAIKPWGEIYIDGRSRGLTPPIKELSVSEGTHRVEVRNGSFPGYASDIEVKAGARVPITHAFGAP